jgi:hypothetical protein
MKERDVDKTNREAFPETAKSIAKHKEHRIYVRQELASLLRLFEDEPGLLGPKFLVIFLQFILKSLAHDFLMQLCRNCLWLRRTKIYLFATHATNKKRKYPIYFRPIIKSE